MLRTTGGWLVRSEGGGGTAPPTSPVLPPWTTTPAPWAAQARTVAATSSVDPGRTTSKAGPPKRRVQSVSKGARSCGSTSTFVGPTMVASSAERAPASGSDGPRHPRTPGRRVTGSGGPAGVGGCRPGGHASILADRGRSGNVGAAGGPRPAARAGRARTAHGGDLRFLEGGALQMGRVSSTEWARVRNRPGWTRPWRGTGTVEGLFADRAGPSIGPLAWCPAQPSQEVPVVDRARAGLTTGHRHRRSGRRRRPPQPARQAQRPRPGHVRRPRSPRARASPPTDRSGPSCCRARVGGSAPDWTSPRFRPWPVRTRGHRSRRRSVPGSRGASPVGASRPPSCGPNFRFPSSPRYTGWRWVAASRSPWGPTCASWRPTPGCRSWRSAGA